nr:hypothetical protein [Tanacetum cinerariifolium]
MKFPTAAVTQTSATALRGAVGAMKEFFILLRDFSNWFMLKIDRGGSMSSQIRASPSNEKGNSNSLTVVLGTSGCLNVDVTLLKKRRWLCGSCLPVIHISVVCCSVGFKFALRNRVLLWRCLKIRVLRWTVLIDSSLVGLTVLIEIVALKTILVVILLSRLMKARWTYLIRNILTILNEISDCCGLKLLNVIMKYEKIISSSSEWTLIIAMI